MIEHDLEVLSKKMVDAKLLTQEQAGEALQKAPQTQAFIRHLITAGLVSKNAAYETLAEIYGTPFVDLSNFQVSAEALQSVPSDLAKRFKITRERVRQIEEAALKKLRVIIHSQSRDI